MLEKIGLPAKPSMRGSNWVVDASHCQGCSSQFTFINRKHHCRRCGGLFCNSCTQQRMVLRGQGDSPVRICEPCKKLEEAARFELRHGHKSRVGKGFSVGGSNISKKNEDEILSQLLRDDGKESFASGHQSDNRTFSSTRSTSSWASSSNIQEASIHDGLGEISRSHSAVEPNFVQNEMGSASPEELRQRASEEKNKYKILKGEGKPEDALKAFKRGKELERQAEAMEILIRKNRRKVTPPGNMVEIREKEARTKGSGRNRKPLPQLSNEKVDLLAELKELGWSDMDIHDQDKKPGSTSLEGEMSSLSGETSQRNDNKKKVPLGIDKTQVVEHKKKALALKREGKLSEAKEELKKAKVLEKQLEEQELLAEAEDSDDEISALIRSMDNEEQSELSNPLIQEQHFDIEHLMGTTDDLDLDTNFEVTDDDTEDPEIAADLKSLGWTDDSDHLENVTPQSLAVNREALLSEILSLKREALSKKRTGNVADAMLHLKKAKLLERDLENLEPHTDNVMAGNSSTIQISSSTRTADKMSMPSKPFLDDGNVRGGDFNLTAKSRVTIQKELLNLKKKALALRREGKFDEAEEELKKGKVLEHQLEEMDTTSKMKVGHMAFDGKGRGSAFEHSVTSQDLPVAEDREDVTDQDMHDPTYLSLLKSIGWNDGHDEPVGSTLEASIQNDKVSLETSKMTSCIAAGTSRRTKAEIQRELLGLKRKALALRREGKADEAEEVLRMSKALEDAMTEIDEAKKVESYRAGSKIGESPFGTVIEEVEKVATEEDDVVDDLGGDGANDEVQVQASTVGSKISSSAPLGEMEPIPDENASLTISASISPALVKQIKEKTEAGSMGCEKALSETGGDIVKTQEFLRQKGLASADKKTSRSTAEGRIGSYIHDSRIGVLVEVNEDMKPHVNETKSAPGNTSQNNQNVPRDTILSHKKKAVALKREGKLAEALEELRQAKLLEKSCQQDNPEKKNGLHDMPASTSNTPLAGPTRDSASNLAPKPAPGRDRFKLQQESLSHKRQALKLRREGRTQEAEAESELAKALEAQLEELAAHEPSKPSVSGAGLADDAVMEDFLDPQLLSALKALGLEDPNTAPQAPARLQRVTDVAEPAKPSVGKNENHGQERIQLEEQIKAEKLKALNLKRSGKQSEALDAFRRAKLLERKLNLLA